MGSIKTERTFIGQAPKLSGTQYGNPDSNLNAIRKWSDELTTWLETIRNSLNNTTVKLDSNQTSYVEKGADEICTGTRFLANIKPDESNVLKLINIDTPGLEIFMDVALHRVLIRRLEINGTWTTLGTFA